MSTTVETAIYRMKVEGRETVDAAAKSVDGLTVAEERATKATRATQQSFDRFQASLSPAIRAQQQYQAALEKVERFSAAGVATDQQRAQVIGMITQRYQTALGAINQNRAANDNLAKSTGLTSHEMKNLGFQLNDVATMLASGSSPMQVLATQSGQVIQILQGSQGGISGAIKSMAASVVSFLGPLGLLAAGLTAVAAAGAAFYELTKKEAPTSEKLLGEHDRLLKVVKDSYDKVTNSAKNWFDQSKAVTMLQLTQQQIDVQKKLNEEVEKFTRKMFEIDFSKSGNMSFGYKVKDEYKAFSDALYSLAESYQKGTPNVKAFTEEVAKIALTTPVLQKLGTELVNSAGDASKFAHILQQTKDMLDGINNGKFDPQQRGRLGFGGSAATVNEYQQLIQRTKDRIDQLKLEAETAGQTGEAVLKMRLQHEAERAAKKAGVEVNQKVIDQLKEELALETQRAKLASIQADIKFERQTLGLSREDAQIAERLRDVYPDVTTAINSSEAAQIRLNNAMREANDNAQQFADTLLQGMLRGQSAMESLSSAAASLGQRFASQGLRRLMDNNLTNSGPVSAGQGALGVIGAAGAGYSSGSPLSGALGGAMAGTAILPGIGTAIGAIVGGIAGMFGSASNARRQEQQRRMEELQRSFDAEERGWKLPAKRNPKASSTFTLAIAA